MTVKQELGFSTLTSTPENGNQLAPEIPRAGQTGAGAPWSIFPLGSDGPRSGEGLVLGPCRSVQHQRVDGLLLLLKQQTRFLRKRNRCQEERGGEEAELRTGWRQAGALAGDQRGLSCGCLGDDRRVKPETPEQRPWRALHRCHCLAGAVSPLAELMRQREPVSAYPATSFSCLMMAGEAGSNHPCYHVIYSISVIMVCNQ